MKVVKEFLHLLPSHKPDLPLMEATAKATERAIKENDWRVYYKFAESESWRKGKPPQFIVTFLDKAKVAAAEGNGLFKTLDIKPEVHYECSRLVTDEVFISFFSGGGAKVPGVYAVMFYVDHGSTMPLVMDAEFGTGALPYMGLIAEEEKSAKSK